VYYIILKKARVNQPEKDESIGRLSGEAVPAGELGAGQIYVCEWKPILFTMAAKRDRLLTVSCDIYSRVGWIVGD